MFSGTEEAGRASDRVWISETVSFSLLNQKPLIPIYSPTNRLAQIENVLITCCVLRNYYSHSRCGESCFVEGLLLYRDLPPVPCHI